MKIKLSLLFVLLLIIQVYSYAPEDKLFTLGSEFLILSNNPSYAIALYDNTTLYADYNDDELWDLKKQINSEDKYNLIKPTGEYLKPGSKIYSSKPILLFQFMDVGGSSYTGQDVGLYVPPIKNLKNNYVVSKGKWNVLCPKQEKYVIDANDTKEINLDSPCYVYSNNSFASLKSDLFYIKSNNIKLLVLKNNTKIEYDYDNDGYYDDSTQLGKGEQILDFLTPGIMVRFDSDVAMQSSYDEVYTSVLPFSYLADNYYSYSGLIYSDHRSNLLQLGICNEKICLSNKTIGNVDLDFLDVVQEKSSSALSYYYGNQPFLLSQCDSGHVDKCYNSLLSYENLPTSDIVFTQLSDSKQIVLNSSFVLNTKLSNTYKNLTIRNISLELAETNGFLFLSNPNVFVRNLDDDSKLDVVFNVNMMDSKIVLTIDILPANSYLDISQFLETPSSYGLYSLESPILSYDIYRWS